MLATQDSTMVYTQNQNQRPEKPSKSLPVPTKNNVRTMTKEERKAFDAKLQRIETLQAKVDLHRGLANSAQERANSAQERVNSAQKGIDACDERSAKNEEMLARIQAARKRGT